VFDGGRTADAAEIARGADTLRWWRALRAARGWAVDLMVETHDALVTTPGIERLLAAAPSTAILWDAHHTWRKGGEDPVATWRVIGSHVVHVHVKDSLPSTGPRLPYAYVLPGTGEFPMAPLRRALGGSWAGTLSFEWEKLWHPQLPELDEALRSAAERRWW
jgi:sugar phosphate isomerase/epimerase